MAQLSVWFIIIFVLGCSCFCDCFDHDKFKVFCCFMRFILAQKLGKIDLYTMCWHIFYVDYSYRCQIMQQWNAIKSRVICSDAMYLHMFKTYHLDQCITRKKFEMYNLVTINYKLQKTVIIENCMYTKATQKFVWIFSKQRCNLNQNIDVEILLMQVLVWFITFWIEIAEYLNG